jgi:hypothetical protein
MASQLRSLKMTYILVQIAEIRAAELGYPSWAAYVKGLIRHDAVCQARHGITVPWSALALIVQDKLDALILSRLRRKKGMKSADMATWDWEAEYEKMQEVGQ